MKTRTPLAVIGGGNMGGAIVAGALRAGLDPSLIGVAEPDDGRRQGLAALGLTTFETGGDAASWMLDREATGPPDVREGQVLLAVKPQAFDGLAGALSDVLSGRSRVVMSILAGVTTSRIEQAIPAARAVRLMPNLPAQIGRGLAAICRGARARPDDDSTARELFGSVGGVIDIDESLMDAFTAVAGSGPAYVFLLAEAMEGGARGVGFEAEVARRIVLETLRGSVELLAREASAPAELRARVTSKGGTTDAAMGVLDAPAFVARFERAIMAARDRGRDLSGS